jgi:hypothetical protein
MCHSWSVPWTCQVGRLHSLQIVRAMLQLLCVWPAASLASGHTPAARDGPPPLVGFHPGPCHHHTTKDITCHGHLTPSSIECMSLYTSAHNAHICTPHCCSMLAQSQCTVVHGNCHGMSLTTERGHGAMLDGDRFAVPGAAHAHSSAESVQGLSRTLQTFLTGYSCSN